MREGHVWDITARVAWSLSHPPKRNSARPDMKT